MESTTFWKLNLLHGRKRQRWHNCRLFLPFRKELGPAHGRNTRYDKLPGIRVNLRHCLLHVLTKYESAQPIRGHHAFPVLASNYAFTPYSGLSLIDGCVVSLIHER